MHNRSRYLSQVPLIALSLLSMLVACTDSRSFFVAGVEHVTEPDEIIDLEVRKIEADNVYSQFFAVHDSLLISSRPNSNDDIFYVANLNNNEFLGSFMHRGQGPSEYLGLNPIRRIERNGDDLVALTYEPNRRELIEWNITKSIETGKDSVLHLGIFSNSNDMGFIYSDIYRISKSKYLGYTPAFFDEGVFQQPLFSVFDGCENAPEKGISFVRDDFSIEEVKEAKRSIFSGVWSLHPDNTKIANAMTWLEQINIIDLKNDEVKSYRVNGSPEESLFKTEMKNAVYQYYDIVCNNNAIYALYRGDNSDDFKGCLWLHEYDWNGNFKKKYKLPVSIMRLWLDASSDNLYGYNEPEDAIFRLYVD